MILDLLTPWLVWFVCGLLLCLLETLLKRCVLVFFGFSCLVVSFAVALLDIGPLSQWLLCLLLGLVLLRLLRGTALLIVKK
ncbi:MAG: hypothetical protein JXQ81_11075 [Desulfuromonadales bacterium]|nr:hypothetical protein [Desulfuromonadales bacterium]MBN2793040.1 hypothetical protein [Desulfuromonadales bacterium]